ncbi:hypothetical protein [uncultured Luteimonas sp.]|uniref:hypothetical protein n=1 Tax=uncultured Luteimonas sp. TaxID=453144 RepID=UPI002622A6B3|nr:hypothetical protein [uncultured Luteimonas sp.]
MNPHPQILRPRTLNVVVQPGQLLPEHSHQVKLYSERRVVDAWYWGDLPAALPGRLRKAVAYLVPVDDRDENRTHHVVTRFDWFEDMEAFNLVPDTFGTDAEDVYRGRELMDWVKHPAIRQLLSDVFTEPDVFFNYWTATHRPLAEAGSLVRNAVVFGEHLRNRTFLTRDLLDLGIAYAVLRDIGNVWYQTSDDSPNTRRKALSGMLQKLKGPLAHFKSTCPEYAPILRELLLAPARPITDRRAQILLRYASEVPEHDGPLIVDHASW